MKRLSIFCFALMALALPLTASVTTNLTGSPLSVNGGYIPDNDPNGWASTINVASGGFGDLIVQSVSVNLTIAGGFNGDLYGYLVHDTGGFVVLLDRVGKTATPGETFGFSNQGFDNITLAASGSSLTTLGVGGASYSSTSQITTGTYAAQATSGSFGDFNGIAASGAWTLFFADRSSGDISQVTGWSLEINAVPEPTTWAMIFFGAAFAGKGFMALRKKKA